jgi:hypothetical protein
MDRQQGTSVVPCCGGNSCLRRAELNTFGRKGVACFVDIWTTRSEYRSSPKSCKLESFHDLCTSSEGLTAGSDGSFHQLKLSLKAVSYDFRFLGIWGSWTSRDLKARWRSRSPQRQILTVQGFQHIAPLFVPPLNQPTDCRPLKSITFGFQSGIPSDVPRPLRPIPQVCFFLNTSGRARGGGDWPRIGAWSQQEQ